MPHVAARTPGKSRRSYVLESLVRTRLWYAFLELYRMFLVGMSPPDPPVGNLLFLGPTGSGKTYAVEVLPKRSSAIHTPSSK